MTLSKATQSRKRFYHLLFTLLILAIVAWGGLRVYQYMLQRQIHDLSLSISSKEAELSSLLADQKFQHYLQIDRLEHQHSQIPRSDYVHKILEILDSIKAVEVGRGGVELSDFKVDLNQLSLNGVVSNLRILYGNKEGSGGLIDKFNQLDFLSEISIRKYEKSDENERSFQFTLSANVINHVSTGSTAH